MPIPNEIMTRAANEPSIDIKKLAKVSINLSSIHQQRCYLSTCLDTLPNPARWKGLKSIGVVECERIIHGKTSIDQRHYITTVTDVATCASRSTRSLGH
jgi:hypothetical protein